MRSSVKKGILFLSNGHSEDTIAAAIIEELLKIKGPQTFDIKAMPFVGKGKAYTQLNIKLLGPRRPMPSGGFMRTGISFFLKDLKAGWLKMLKEYVNTLKIERSSTDLIVCVGDIFLLLVARFFGKRPIIFLPTAKSDYIREHYGVEKWLMRRLCKLVIPRDEKTACSLRSSGINAIYVGNAMMDCLGITGKNFGVNQDTSVVGILPGSREEAYENLMTILDAALIIAKKSSAARVDFLLSLASSLDSKRVGMMLPKSKGWTMKESTLEERKTGIIAYLVSRAGPVIKIIQDRFFGDVVNSSKVIIGTSGMANEQAVGLGKPVVTFPGRGAQTTRKFLQIQQRLLGGGVFIEENSGKAVANKVCWLLRRPEELNKVARIGKERMGQPGASGRIAKLIISFPLSPLSS